ncbi:MAG: zinc-ribbon domain-containing protein [Legionella sp.]|nr:zinc-ribbon domain-containing protein [Legionella sp.]
MKINSLASKAPHLSEEWHKSKNSLTSHEVSYSSNKKFWWICKKGHEWQAVVGNRYRGTGCPICSGRRLSQENNLAVKCPHLLKEWHPTKNADLSPFDVTPRGKDIIWWQCKKGHEWQAKTGNRYMGTGCPYCAGKIVSPEYNLAIKSPRLAQEWHPEKNNPLTPFEITPKTPKIIWWLCEKGHEWQACVGDRFKGSDCPYCAEKKASSEYNLAIKHPHLISEWHTEKNKPLTPESVTPGSKKRVWWQCRWNHEWEAAVYTRAAGHNCPKCNIRTSRLEIRIYCELKRIFDDALWQEKVHKKEVDVYIPRLALGIEIDGFYWHQSDGRKQADKAKQTTLAANGVTLIRVVDDRLEVNESNSIPYVNGEEHLNVVLRLLAFIRLKLKLTETDRQKIDEYICANEYTNKEEYGAIVSALPAPLMKRSIAGHPGLLKEWHPSKNVYQPAQLSYGSRIKVWWLCGKGHEWEATPNSRTRPQGTGCPYCSGKQATHDNNLAVKSPELVKEWHPDKNNELMPEMFLPRSNKKVWWLCGKGHEWQASIDNRFNGTNCPLCWSAKE